MRHQALALILVLGASLLFQAWFIGPTPRGAAIDADYLQRILLSTAYTKALAAGQSHLLVEPDPHLLTPPDPFAPEFRQYILSDTSLYRGHYYLYFGIVPFVTLLVPWFKLTGTILTPGFVIIFFCGVGYLGYAGALLLGIRRWSIGCSTVAVAAAFAALIVSSGTWPLMGRPAIYEMENATAFACLAWSLFFLLWAETSPDAPRLGLMMAGGFAALTLGCRPNYFPAATVIAAWIIYRSWTPTPGLLPRVARALTNLAPLILVGAGLAWWNYHRFNNPLDFGLKHTVSMDPRVARPLATLSNLPYNVHRYLLGSARLARYFPFIQGTTAGPFPLGSFQEPTNQVYGFLLISPILVGAAAMLYWAKSRAGGFGPFAAVAFLTFLGNFAFLACVTMSCYRYPADFLGPLALLAALGMLTASALEPGWARYLAMRLALPLLLLWSGCAVIFQLYSIAQTSMLFDVIRPADFATAARPFNRVIYMIEQMRHDGPRALGVTVRLPKDRVGHVEPLVVVGDNGAQDFLYLNYVQAGAIQLGFESMGHGGLRSRYAPIDYGQPHRFEVRYGSFLPPDDHPLLSQMTPADRFLARRMITVLVDGQIVLDGWADFHSPQANFFIGQSPNDAAFGANFSGEILQVDWPQLPVEISPSRWQRSAYGPITANVTLRALPVGVFDPLLSLGEANQGAEILVEHLKDSQLRLLWLDTQGRKIISEPFAWPAGETRKVEISSGALLPPLASSVWPGSVSAEERAARKSRLRVTVDGSQILDVECPSADVSPATVAMGEDRLFLQPGVMPTFTGSLGSPARAAW